MFKEVSEVCLVQADGGLPTPVAAGSAPGESGVFVSSLRFLGGLHVSATPRRHQIFFQLNPQARFDCHIAGKPLQHQRIAGSYAIAPAGADYAADAEGSVDAILVAIEPGQFALAAAEGAAIETQLIERLNGFDQALCDSARRLALECANGYPNGALFWNAIANAFVDGLLARHTSNFESRVRGRLDKDMLRRLRDYVVANLDESIEVETLAKIAGRSPFHFTRVFARSVGTTPYRYIVHLRLRRALELIREGRCGLAEIAATTGFADQSHLSRWVRRVHGVSPTQIADR
ncbi:MAG TPA: AraC family transcriptional regulator [Xanthobacteraceae bacterium]|nr:AraC family transcriptional regulator [Xanthobacteraceae bacterium]